MESILVSIVIPVYNNELYLEKCLKSVQSIDYKAIEIIVIDDGSSDKSSDIIDLFALQDERFIVRHISNRGVSAARNLGISIAKGKYLMFIDSDDSVEHDLLNRMVQVMENSAVGLCIRAQSYQKDIYEDFEIEIKSQNIDKILFLHENYLLYGPHSKLYRMNVINQYDVAFPESIDYGEDLMFNMSYLDHIDKVKYIAEAKYYYTMENTSSLSRKTRWNMFEVEYRLFLRLQEWFKTHELLDDNVRKFLNTRLVGTAYDSVCLIFHKKCYWSLVEKKQYLKKILENPYVIEALNNYDNRDYSNRIISYMKNKRYIKLLIRSMVH